jgi:hypothetical protein
MPSRCKRVNPARGRRWREFREQRNRLAGLGLARGEHAVIYSPNCLEYLLVSAAARAAGAVPVPNTTNAGVNQVLRQEVVGRDGAGGREGPNRFTGPRGRDGGVPRVARAAARLAVNFHDAGDEVDDPVLGDTAPGVDSRLHDAVETDARVRGFHRCSSAP